MSTMLRISRAIFLFISDKVFKVLANTSNFLNGTTYSDFGGR
jgi:hypothetical protein